MSIRSGREWISAPADTGAIKVTKQRRTIRYLAAALAAVAAVIYFMIGFRVVTVLNTPEYQTFGIAAGLAYVLGAVLLAALDHRVVGTLGAILQAVVIYTYFDVAAERIPTFELWGIVLRIVQVLILIALIYLEVRRPLPPPEKPVETDY